MTLNTGPQLPDMSEKNALELTISRMSDVIAELTDTLGALVNDLDPYYEGFCIVCGCPQPSRKHLHDHSDGCAYVNAREIWLTFQPPDYDGPIPEDLI